MKNYPKLCIFLLWKPQGGIYSHQGRGRPGDKPWPEAARAPRLYGRRNAAIKWPCARRFEPRAALFISCQFWCPVSGLQALGFTESAL